MLKKSVILGIRLNDQSKIEIWEELQNIINKDEYSKKIVVTPNPEILVHAYNNKNFKAYLNQADFSLADGFGLRIFAKLSGQKLERIVGADLVKDLLKKANENFNKVLILNWNGGLSTIKEIEDGLLKIYPQIKLKVLEMDRNNLNNSEIFQKINNFSPDIFLNTLGNPYQEKYLVKYKEKLNFKLALAVGASIDFIIGKQVRAPKWMQNIGMEWFYRWLKKPVRRTKRIWNAVVVFSVLNIYWFWRTKFTYRPNIITLLYNSKNEILLASKNHPVEEFNEEQGEDWEIPQGGLEPGEDRKIAAMREISEELGILMTDVEVEKIYDNVWRYNWDAKYMDKNYCLYKGYRGQKQDLAIIKLKDDNILFDLKKEDELKEIKWVNIDEALRQIHEMRREGSKKAIELFRGFIKK